MKPDWLMIKMTPESSSKALAVNAKFIRKIVSIERELFTTHPGPHFRSQT
jgi:hypothetical protein